MARARARGRREDATPGSASPQRTLELYERLLRLSDALSGANARRCAPLLEIVFWLCVALIVWTQVGYALALALARARVRARSSAAHGAARGSRAARACPSLSLIVAAHDEEAVIAAKVANALALDYPRELLEVIVACDGCADATAARAREAGADLVLELPRGGKIRAQDAAVERARGEIVAFSDANALWEPDARARAGRRRSRDPRVGYACGQVRFVQAAERRGRDQPGGRLLALRAGGARAGVAAVLDHGRQRRDLRDPPRVLHRRRPDHGPRPVAPLQHGQARAGARCTCPSARASEKMVPSIEGEFARKRRMMSHTWPILLRGGMLSPRGYPPGYALMIFSHRLLRYCTPVLHVLALAANVALVALGAGPLYVVTLALQLALLLAARAGRRAAPARPLLIARYYVLTTASPAAGPVGLAAPRHRAPPGRPRRDTRVIAVRRARRHRWSPRSRSLLSAPAAGAGGDRDPAGVARARSIYRQRRVGLRRARRSTC